MGKHTDQFDAALGHITDTRGKVYGPAAGAFARIEAI